MKKLLFVLACVSMLSACEQPPRTDNHPVDFPELLVKEPGFEDCKMVKLVDRYMQAIYVVRCPNSTVSTKSKNGKSNMNIVTTSK